MTKRGTAGTRADEVYLRLRGEIFSGRLVPGERLKFPEVCSKFETSVGVAREALTRLASERLVTLHAHQGYAVAALSARELTDLTLARLEVEALAFRLSIQNGDDTWESELVAAHHILSLREREVAVDGTRGDRWYAAHEDFHAALLAGCGSRRLTSIAGQLRAETELYRRWAAPLMPEYSRDPAAEHQALADAALARETEHGVDLLRKHISFTTEMLLGQLTHGDPQTAGAGSPASPVDGVLTTARS